MVDLDPEFSFLSPRSDDFLSQQGIITHFGLFYPLLLVLLSLPLSPPIQVSSLLSIKAEKAGAANSKIT
jgi:hypothetical protein